MNFATLQTIAAMVAGRTLASAAIVRLAAIHAPIWIIRGLLSADCSRAEQGKEFGFSARWFGVIAELDRDRGLAEESQGEC
jgi:hypothetical protein